MLEWGADMSDEGSLYDYGDDIDSIEHWEDDLEQTSLYMY
jgi:hypothetical protein